MRSSLLTRVKNTRFIYHLYCKSDQLYKKVNADKKIITTLKSSRLINEEVQAVSTLQVGLFNDHTSS